MMRKYLSKTLAFFLYSILCGVLAVTVSAQTPSPTPPEADDDDVIKIDSRLVQIEAVVRDKKGNLVRDLTADDFELVEDGKVRPVEFFTYVPLTPAAKGLGTETVVEEVKGITRNEVKRTFVFLVSNPNIKQMTMINSRWHSDAYTMSYQRYSMLGLELSERFLHKFINESMTGSDLVSIVDTESNLGPLSNFTNDREQLRKATEYIRAGLTKGRYPTHNVSLQVTDRTFYWHPGDLLQQNINTLMMAESAIDQLRKLPGQKMVFLMSRGMLGNADIAGADAVRARLQRVIEKANRAKVTFYTLSLRTLGESAAASPVIQGGDVMIKLANDTGGKSVQNTNDISIGFKKILEENNGYYQLAFSPEDSAVPRAYQVKIRLKRPGLTAEHRSSVYQTGAETPAQEPKDRVLRLLNEPFASRVVNIKLGTTFRVVNKKQGSITTVVNISPDLLEPNLIDSETRQVKLNLGIQVTEPDNIISRREVKNFSLKISQDSWQHIQKEGLVYQFETQTKKQGTYNVKIAACINETDQCGISESLVNVK